MQFNAVISQKAHCPSCMLGKGHVSFVCSYTDGYEVSRFTAFSVEEFSIDLTQNKYFVYELDIGNVIA